MGARQGQCTDYNNSKTKVLIVDDHPVVLEGLTQLINREDDLVVCAQAGNAKDALAAVEKQQVDLAVVDMLLEDTTGVQVTENLRSRCPGLNILILSMSDEPRYIKRAFQAGARGYITKEEVAEGIVAAIRRVRGGRIYVGSALSKRFSSKTLDRISAGDFSDSVWDF